MFYTEEDVQPAVDLAVKIFGKPEQYHTWSEGQVMMNVAVMTRKFGKIWTGDLLMDRDTRNASTELQRKLDLLADSINQPVFLTDGDFDFTLAIAVSQK